MGTSLAEGHQELLTDKGYNLVGSNTHTCQATGLWS